MTGATAITLQDGTVLPALMPLTAGLLSALVVYGRSKRPMVRGSSTTSAARPTRRNEKPDLSTETMHTYDARITWSRDDATFSGGRYSRGHEWSFDGGVKVAASASPSHVPHPYSIAEAVDPEEAVVAAAASCHMLMFLFLAAKRGFVVDSYVDDAFGVVTTGHDGRLSFSRITLRPQVRFSSNAGPGADEIAALHHAAHDGCYVANSLKCDVVVETATGAVHSGTP